MAVISALDRTILRLLQKNARTRLDDITAKAGASAATVQRLFFEVPNVKRFRTSVVMDPTKVGMSVPV